MPSVALGPFDTAGCGSALARALRGLGHDAELAVFEPHPFGYPTDRVLTRTGRVAYALRAPLVRDVIHYQFGRTWLPGQVDAVWAAAARAMRLVSFYGDDCRLYAVARRLFPPRGAVGNTATDRAVARRLARLGRVCRAAIVGDLELATYVRPHFARVYVVPLPIHDPEAEERTRRPTGPLRVLHAPSDRDVKGTTAIQDAVAEAGRQVELDFRVVSGVPHDALARELADADVVIDQLNSVTTGVFALEAMRLGLPVLSEVDRDAVAPFQREYPVVDVTRASLQSELVAIAGDADRRRRLGAAGREFVSRYHLPGAAAEAVTAVYRHARGREGGLFQSTADGLVPLREADRLLRERLAAVA